MDTKTIHVKGNLFIKHESRILIWNRIDYLWTDYANPGWPRRSRRSRQASVSLNRKPKVTKKQETGWIYLIHLSNLISGWKTKEQ